MSLLNASAEYEWAIPLGIQIAGDTHGHPWRSLPASSNQPWCIRAARRIYKGGEENDDPGAEEKKRGILKYKVGVGDGSVLEMKSPASVSSKLTSDADAMSTRVLWQ